METILEFIPNLKIICLLLIILIMVIINIILNKKNINSSYKYLINGITLIILSLIVSNISDIINGIFNLNYLSIKLYLVTLIIINIITILTLKKKFSFIYRILNYFLFSLTSIILLINIVIVGNNFLNIFKFNLSKYSTTLINISIIIFIIYLTILSFIYIVKNLTKNKAKETKFVTKDKINLKEVLSNKLKTNVKEDKTIIKDNALSLEELLSIPDKQDFSINGINCSIIFEDSIPENILINYYTLLNDINAKMVNGYTLEENKILKSICTKLETNNLSNIDINNLTLLNKISPDEYSFLKHIFKDQNI